MLKHLEKKEETIIDDLQVGFGKNSWYINVPLYSCRNLFEGEDTSFQVQAFACKCGKQHIYITKTNENKILYICQNCKNSYFFNTNHHTNKYNDLLINIDEEPVLSITKEYAYADLYINLPVNIDLSKNEIIFEKKKVYRLRICLNGGEERHQETHIMTSDVVSSTYNKLLSFIDQNYLSSKLNNYNSLHMEKRTPPQFRKAVTYFLKYPLFNDAEFLSWYMDESLYLKGGV